MEMWAKLIILILVALNFALWFMFLEYWIVNSTNIVSKKIIWTLKIVAFIINSLIIAVPILFIKSNWSLLYYSLPMTIIPFIIGHIWFILARKRYSNKNNKEEEIEQ